MKSIFQSKILLGLLLLLFSIGMSSEAMADGMR